MKFADHLYSAFLGFAVGAILMAYIANYNRSQLPMAILCLVLSILFRKASE